MATFNPMAAPMMADTMVLNGMHNPALGMDQFEQDITFDEALLVNGNLGPVPFTPTYDFDNFATTFEDPFAYPRPYEVAPRAEDFHHDDSPPQQPDDKLLGFSVTAVKASPLDDTTGAYSEPFMSAELYGMFFVAEDVFGGETTGRPLELTCYRRNLWQCSGQITMPRHCTQVLNEQGRQVPIDDFWASVSAVESIEGKTTEIISIPWKSNNPALGDGQETKVASAPPKMALDPSSGQEIDGHRVSIPVSWKRLQFKSATANNGRRKGLQQHYVVLISLLGRIQGTNEFVKIAEIQSGPVIVRGRSPRNFDSKKDVPLTGDKKPHPPAHPERERSTSDVSSSTAPHNLKTERANSGSSLHRYQAPGNIVIPPPSSNEWGAAQAGYQSQPHSAKRAAISPNMNRPPIPAWNPSVHRTPNKTTPPAPTMPINLSLSEDERSPHNQSGSEALTSPGVNRTNSVQPRAGSPVEEDDLLYEYFPLSLDDWTPLVDTVYRPHIVHHIAIPQEIKAQAIRSKAKRYFSAD
ncbi:acid phosphatase [Microdochium trichocladiopsis]|uniref:Acid phosphatase n=1 Tax=Microdochium trichocladiopsis TaxID=1682393 RepID=A0A9P8YHB5_9PEZI|nr:acid phosphatase [Microdochium trichocladiopsis]KAH7040280.1 acid phosphatase [Microdochium trichocladiopsis]